MNELIKSIKEHEGFRGVVYKDHLGYDTIGYGTKMPLGTDEAELLLVHRLKKMIKHIKETEPFFNELPLEKQEIIAEMVYQMGVNGVLGFKKMWKALKQYDYKEAAKEGLDSKWATQTPRRANELMNRLRS